mmetsp:Transcript_19729/g.40967  ORF Transcript_19729/g.40967 Transcript_19729/m.40967 type:complete len:124 (-) Transcript_19729:160-531(-)
MGNICCPSGESDIDYNNNNNNNNNNNTKTKAFSGAGNRLGTSNVPSNAPSASYGTSNQQQQPVIPDPIVNPNLSQTDRDRIRMERAQAAEKRLKAMGGDKKKKKKVKDNTLRGPNSEPLMRWS